MLSTHRLFCLNYIMQSFFLMMNVFVYSTFLINNLTIVPRCTKAKFFRNAKYIHIIHIIIEDRRYSYNMYMLFIICNKDYYIFLRFAISSSAFKHYLSWWKIYYYHQLAPWICSFFVARRMVPMKSRRKKLIWINRSES